jgi:hypothetical protein
MGSTIAGMPYSDSRIAIVISLETRQGLGTVDPGRIPIGSCGLMYVCSEVSPTKGNPHIAYIA